MIIKNLILALFVFSFILTGCNAQNNKSNGPGSSKSEIEKSTVVADTANQLMAEDEFWKIIDKSNVAANNNYQLQIESIKTIPLALEPINIEKFDNRFTALLAASYTYKLWGASFVINGGCSDDCFDYFRQYLIAHGKEKFYKTLANPESCVSWVKSEEQEGWEGFQAAIMDAYMQKTGKAIPKSYQPKFEIKGEPFDEEKVEKQYPKLAKKFMGDDL